MLCTSNILDNGKDKCICGNKSFILTKRKLLTKFIFKLKCDNCGHIIGLKLVKI